MLRVRAAAGALRGAVRAAASRLKSSAPPGRGGGLDALASLARAAAFEYRADVSGRWCWRGWNLIRVGQDPRSGLSLCLWPGERCTVYLALLRFIARPLPALRAAATHHLAGVFGRVQGMPRRGACIRIPLAADASVFILIFLSIIFNLIPTPRSSSIALIPSPCDAVFTSA